MPLQNDWCSAKAYPNRRMTVPKPQGPCEFLGRPKCFVPLGILWEPMVLKWCPNPAFFRFFDRMKPGGEAAVQVSVEESCEKLKAAANRQKSLLDD